MPRKAAQKAAEVVDLVSSESEEGDEEEKSSGGESLFSDDGDLRPDDSENEARDDDETVLSEEVAYSSFSKISTKEVQDMDALRLRSLSRHRNVLRPFVTEKVYNKLCAAIEHRDGRAACKENAEDALVNQPPTMKTCVLREYQLEGLNWLVQNYNAGINCILGDEMGLGKTIQSIAFFSHCIHVRKLSGPFLVVVPLTVLFNWMIELQRFCPALQALRVHTSDVQESKRLRAQLLRHPHVVVTTYEMLKTAHMGSALKRLVYRGIFLDEGHRIRNEGTDVSRACCSLKALFKVVLTGTPLQNNLRETGVILSFLAPNVFTDLARFEGAFDLTT
ncbi:DEAD/DEAH box helicase, partial [archaeon]